MPRTPKRPAHLAPGMTSEPFPRVSRHSRSTRLQERVKVEVDQRQEEFANLLSRVNQEREREAKEGREGNQSSSEYHSGATHLSKWTPPDLQKMSKEELHQYHERNQVIIANLKLQGLGGLYADKRFGLTHTYHSISIPSRSTPFFQIDQVWMRYYRDRNHHVFQEVLDSMDHDDVRCCEVSPIAQTEYQKASTESIGLSLSRRRARMYGFVTREEGGGTGGGGEGRRW